jgi:molybdenum cofactor synthesis domain-containing protein
MAYRKLVSSRYHCAMSDGPVTACVLIIGNEILSGRTQDVNLAHLAQTLNEYGVQVREARVIPDVEEVIVDTLNECRRVFDYVLTTGGIGPTHDDITADCVAKAFGIELEMHPEVEALIRRREAPAEIMEARLRMARIPRGARLIENAVGGPPGFQVENVFVMAGVPAIMRAMVATLGDRLQGGEPVRSRSIIAFLTEGHVAKRLGEIQDRYPALDLGSYPFYNRDRYGTNLVMRGTDADLLDAMLEEVREMIVALGGEYEEP